MAGPGNLFLNIPIQVQGVSGISQAVNTSTATMIPAALAVLPAGTLLRGNIAGRDPNGNSILKTEKGDLLLKTDYFLKRDTELMIKLEGAKDEMFAKIVTIDGKSVSRYLESQGLNQPEEEVIISSRPLTPQLSQQPLPPPGASTLPASQPGMIYPQLKAVLLSPSPQAAMQPQLPPEIAQVLKTVQPGIQFQMMLKIVDIVFPTLQQETQHALTTPPNTPPSPPPPATTNATTAQPLAVQNPATPPTAPAATTAPNPLQQPIIPAPANTANIALPQQPPPQPTAATIPSAPPTGSAAITSSAAAITSSLTAPPALAPENTKPTTPNTAPQQMVTQSSSPLPITSSNNTPPPPPVSSIPAAQSSQTQAPNPVLHNQVNYTSAPTTTTPSLLEAQVMTQDRTGSITAHTSLGLTRIFAPQQLPQGTRIFFEISTITPSTTTDITAPQATVNSQPQARLAAFDALSHLVYPAAQFPPGAPPIHLLPHTDNDLGTELFLLLSAMKGGDFKKWVQTQPRFEMDKLGDELLQKLQGDFSALRTVAVDSRDGSHWNLYNLPLYVGVGIEQIKFFHRDPHKEEKDGKNSKREETSHFIFDISFSSLGHMQFDGLLQRPEKNQLHFDLAVRSERPLSEQIRQDIRSIYISAQEVSGFFGGISFFTGKDACRSFDAPRPTEDHSSIMA